MGNHEIDMLDASLDSYLYNYEDSSKHFRGKNYDKSQLDYVIPLDTMLLQRYGSPRPVLDPIKEFSNISTCK